MAAAYLVSAALAVLAGLIDAAYIGHVDAQLSRSLNLDSVAAAVIGGVVLTGGAGTSRQTVPSAACCWPSCSCGCCSWAPGVGGQLRPQGAAILAAVWLQRRDPSGRTANR